MICVNVLRRTALNVQLASNLGVARFVGTIPVWEFYLFRILSCPHIPVAKHQALGHGAR